jgi:hypothetical protein
MGGNEMSGSLVSVIIPTFNRAATIARAVESVLQQTYRPLDLIVVDDGSTDGTAAILRAYGDSVTYVYQDNAGPSAARNRGFRQANGDFIAFLDSDDVWLATKLERQVNLLERAGDAVPCCLCDTLMRTSHGVEQSAFQIAWMKLREPEGLWLNPAAVLATRFVLFCQAALIRREALRECGGFDERLWVMEDHDLALRLAVRGSWAYLRDPLAVWCGANDDLNLSVAARKNPPGCIAVSSISIARCWSRRTFRTSTSESIFNGICASPAGGCGPNSGWPTDESSRESGPRVFWDGIDWNESGSHAWDPARCPGPRRSQAEIVRERVPTREGPKRLSREPFCLGRVTNHTNL